MNNPFVQRKTGRRILASLLALVMLSVGFAALPASAANGVELFTPYTSLSLPPGETVNYDIELINATDSIQKINLGVDAGGNDWNYELRSGGRNVSQISVKPDSSATVSFSLTVPLEVAKGSYTFRITAGDFGALPLQVNVSEQGSYRSEFEVSQPNMQGYSDSTFTYSLLLNNKTATTQQYGLNAGSPAGWESRFTVDGKDATSVEIVPNSSKTITLTLTPSDSAQADTYKVPIRAEGGGTSAETEVEAVITGKYGIGLSTSDDRLSADITAGSERKLELVVTNTGTAELKNVNLTSTAPAGWEVSFEPKTLAAVQPGQSAPVTATVKASDRALAGDYVMSLSANSPEKTANATVRMTVKTSVLWGWIGVLIILAVLAGVYGLFHKYGRR